MVRDLVIGLDSSTTGCKAIVWDAHGVQVAQGRRGIGLLMPRPAWHEQHAEEWWSAAAASLHEALSQIEIGRLAALAISHQRETFVPVDSSGNPLRPAIVWMDERSRALLPELEQIWGCERYHRITGRPLTGNLSVGKIFWLRQNEPDLFQKTSRYLDVQAFLVHHLTGHFHTGWGSADPMGLFDMDRKCWSEEILRGIGLREEQMPELLPPGIPLGTVAREAAAACGLPAGLPVICGIGDGQAAGLGVDITRPGAAYLNLGTAVVSGTYSDCYTVDRAFRTTTGGIRGTYLLETVLLGGAYTVSWFVERFGDKPASTAPGTAASTLDAEVAALPAGASGLMLVPYWNSAMTPYWDAAASGITVGWRGSHDRRHFYRAILEGIAYEQRLYTEAVEAATGERVQGYVAMGGGSRSQVWCQIMADVTGKPVWRAATAEASALGAGVLAACGAGLYQDARAAAAAMVHVDPHALDPVPALHVRYSRLYEEVYRHLYPALQPFLRRLTELSHDDSES